MKEVWYLARGDLSQPFAAGTIHSREDVKALRRAGFDAKLFSLASEPYDVVDGVKEEVVCRRSNRLSPLWFEIKMCLRILFSPPGSIILRGIDYPLLPWFARLRKVQMIAEFPAPPQGLYSKNIGTHAERLHKKVLSRLDGVISLTRETLEMIQPYMRSGAWEVVTGVGVEVNDYPPSPTDPQCDSETLNIGFLGAMHPYGGARGLPQIFDTLSVLAGKGFPIHWHIIGDGGYREILEQKIAEAGLGGKVTFWGFQPPEKLPECLSKCDLMMALYEPIEESKLGGVNPMKLWTCLAMAKPSLFNYPSRYNVYESVPGLLNCTSIDPDDIADTLSKLWQTHGAEGLRQLGQQGREYVEKHASWDKHVTAYVSHLAKGMGE